MFAHLLAVASFVRPHVPLHAARRAPVALAAASTDTPAIIIGGGRIGGLLRNLGCKGDVVVRRGDPFPAVPSDGPIYICTRNDELAGIVAACPPDRRADLVFLQNGMLDSFLSSEGLQENTQALLYLAVAAPGQQPVDGITTRNPEGLTVATGKWAEAFAARLARGGLRCSLKSGAAYRAALLEKHAFICATNVVGGLIGGLSVGEVYAPGAPHEPQLRALLAELLGVGAAELGVSLEGDEAFERLAAYGRSVPDFPTAVKEFEWRNGWFWELSRRAALAGEPEPLPLHSAALRTLGVVKEGVVDAGSDTREAGRPPPPPVALLAVGSVTLFAALAVGLASALGWDLLGSDDNRGLGVPLSVQESAQLQAAERDADGRRDKEKDAEPEAPCAVGTVCRGETLAEEQALVNLYTGQGTRAK